jgi:methionyl-tRNA formyltransferase
VSTRQGVLAILELQASSGKRMPIARFLRGTEILPGTRLH